MTTELREAIARLRHASDDGRIANADVMLVCDALDAAIERLAHLKPAPKFDKTNYQREYMRKRRKRAKLIRDSSRWLPPKESS
jgi:hypothetical protein